MRFRATIEGTGKSAAGIRVPDEVVTALGPSRKPPVRMTINGHTIAAASRTWAGYSGSASPTTSGGSGVAAGDRSTSIWPRHRTPRGHRPARSRGGARRRPRCPRLLRWAFVQQQAADRRTDRRRQGARDAPATDREVGRGSTTAASRATPAGGQWIAAICSINGPVGPSIPIQTSSSWTTSEMGQAMWLWRMIRFVDGLDHRHVAGPRVDILRPIRRRSARCSHRATRRPTGPRARGRSWRRSDRRRDRCAGGCCRDPSAPTRCWIRRWNELMQAPHGLNPEPTAGEPTVATMAPAGSI